MICNYKTTIETVWYLLGWTNLVMMSLKAVFVTVFEVVFLARTEDYSTFVPVTSCDKILLPAVKATQIESFFTIILCAWQLILSIGVVATVCVPNEFDKKKSSIANFLLLHAVLVPVYCINLIGIQDDASLYFLDKIQPEIWNLPDLVIFIVLMIYLFTFSGTFWIRSPTVPVTTVAVWHGNSDNDSPVMSANAFYRKRNRDRDNQGVIIEEIEAAEDRAGGHVYFRDVNELHECLPITFRSEHEMSYSFHQNYDCESMLIEDGFPGLRDWNTEPDMMEHVPVHEY